jgi:pimeloyl-ACP methyl ester carboxylesterase
VSYLWGRRDPFFAPAAVRATRSSCHGPATGRGLDRGHWLPELEPDAVAAATREALRSADWRSR